MMKKHTGIYQTPLFNFPNLTHGFSTKQFGDMRNPGKQKIFLAALSIEESSFVQQGQVHTDFIHVASVPDRGTTISDVDGLVYKKISKDPPIFLSVHIADCAPLLAVDPVTEVIGVAHAGWKGTLLHIGKNLIKQMVKIGAQREEIRVVIGPRICVDCYGVESDRAQVFQKEFPESDVVVEKNRKFFVNIGKANWSDILVAGVQPDHIDYDPSYCTYSRSDEFYSFRRSGKPLDGEMMGVIGFRK